MKKFAAADAANDLLGSAAGDAIKASSQKNVATGTTACTSEVVFTIPKAAKNVVVAASKTTGIKIGDKGAYGTVTAAQMAKKGCTTTLIPNDAAKACPAEGAAASTGTAVTGNVAGGLSAYQAVKNAGEVFVWGITVTQSTTAAGAAGAKNDTKKDATTLAVGAAAGLIAAAIA